MESRRSASLVTTRSLTHELYPAGTQVRIADLEIPHPVHSALEALLGILGTSLPFRGLAVLHVRAAGVVDCLNILGLHALGAELEPRFSGRLGLRIPAGTSVQMLNDHHGHLVAHAARAK